MVDHIADEVDQMILGQPFTQARRKQKPLLWKVRTVALAQDPLCTTAFPFPPARSPLSTVRLSQTHLISPTDSDTLLGICMCESVMANASTVFRIQDFIQRVSESSAALLMASFKW